MKHTLLLVFAFLSFITASAQNKQKTFVEKVMAKYKAAGSISYDINYRIKFFSEDDTITQKGTVYLVRKEKDTVFSSHFWYDVLDEEQGNSSKYYNSTNAYFIEHEKKSVERFDIAKGENFVINGATDGQFINVKFVKPGRIPEILNNPENRVTYIDTVLKKVPYVVARVHFADRDEYTNEILTFYFNTKTEILDKITYRIDELDQFQYNQWDLSNVSFDKETEASLQKKYETLTKGFTVTDYKPIDPEEEKPLANGTPAPAFTAKSYPDFKEVSLAGYKGKIVLLDFWYMACGWCVKAMPALNNLQQKYKDDVVVLGVNPFDNDEKRIAKMPAFIKRNNLVYSLAYIDSEVSTTYKAIGYPTLYVIDQNGIIQHCEGGYSDDMEQTLDGVIQKLLKK